MGGVWSEVKEKECRRRDKTREEVEVPYKDNGKTSKLEQESKVWKKSPTFALVPDTCTHTLSSDANARVAQ